MQEWIIATMNSFGYVGVALLIAIENIFPPIPSEIILTFGGFMTTFSSMSIPGVIIAATIGSVVGAIILFLLGRLFNAQKMEAIVEKWGKPLRLKRTDIQKAEKWFEKYGPKTVFFCRFIPIIRSLISIPAGMTHMNFGLFVVLTTIGTTIWNIVLVVAGALVGENWELVAGVFERFSDIMLIVFIIIALVIAGIYIWSRFHKNKKKSDDSTE